MTAFINAEISAEPDNKGRGDDLELRLEVNQDELRWIFSANGSELWAGSSMLRWTGGDADFGNIHNWHTSAWTFRVVQQKLG